MTEFPGIVKLIDTGTRRYPKAGEIYFWQDRDGSVTGPFSCDTDEGDADWASKPHDFAIYRAEAQP